MSESVTFLGIGGHLQRNTQLVGFHIASDGRFEQVRVLESSGRPRLDRAALETVRRTSPFRPPPPALNEADREIRLPVVFRLQ